MTNSYWQGFYHSFVQAIDNLICILSDYQDNVESREFSEWCYVKEVRLRMNLDAFKEKYKE